MNTEQKSEHPAHEKYVYFVDGAKFEWGNEKITGKEIKARDPKFNPAYALYLESQNKEPDKLINDDTVVHLGKEKEPSRFYTVPPATFGAR